MRTIVAIAVLLVVALVPSGQSHVAADVNPNGWGASVSCSSPSTLLPSSGGCTKFWNVPSGAIHAHSTFVFPLGGVMTQEIRIQERTPIIGDYITWYDRVCTNTFPQSDSTRATCAGGSLRDWHAGTSHKWIAEAQQTACVPTLCQWTMATVFY